MLAGALEPYATALQTVLAALVGIELSGANIHTIRQEAGVAAQVLLTKGILGDSRQFLQREWQ